MSLFYKELLISMSWKALYQGYLGKMAINVAFIS